jgi:alpha-ribazole phosphatase
MRQTNLWLIRHAPVDGPRGVIHGPDAPADLGDAAAFAALKARLPGGALAVCSPARRTRETAERLGLVAVEQAAFREQDFGAWTGRRHDELERELGPAYREFWKSAASNRPPGGESFVDQIARASAGLRLSRGRGDPRRAFRHHPRRARHRARSCARARRCAS